MPTVTLQPFALVVECQAGESIFEIAARAGKPLTSACGAKATCGLCRIKILDGDAHLTPCNADEKRHLGNVTFLTKMRLGCQARVSGDVVVEIPRKS